MQGIAVVITIGLVLFAGYLGITLVKDIIAKVKQNKNKKGEG